MEAGVTRTGLVTAPGSVAESISEEDALPDGFALPLDRSQKGGFHPDALFDRLKQLDVDEDGTVAFQLRPQTDYDIETEESSLERDVKRETFCRDELQRHGGRPVCSIEAWIRIVDHPDEPCRLLFPWLQHPKDASSKGVEERRHNSLSTVFTAQLGRWWEFMKWQWRQRDDPDCDDIAFSFYLESRRRRRGSYAGHQQQTPEASTRTFWDENVQYYDIGLSEEEWNGFESYHKALRRRLANYAFQRPLQLRKDPRKQSAWTTWLEYLGFELLWLEERVYDVEAREVAYDEAWRTMATVAAEITEKRQVPGQPVWDHPVELHGKDAAEDLFMAEKTIINFVKKTASYREKELVRRQQRDRVKWIEEEARLMEKEKTTPRAPRPRRREPGKPDEKLDEPPSLRRSKRIRGNNGGQRLEKATATAASSQTGRRNAKRTKIS